MKPGHREEGFALLLVFLMAATIAITMYMEIPRVAFEAQRQKEQLLIERGEQYKRAIYLFVKANNRYPGTMDELESFNNRRYLRHKFIDPMTGKAEWRLIHINGGVFTDSKINKAKAPGTDQQQQASTAGQYVGQQAGIGVAPNPADAQNTNPALRRRASEGGAAAPVLGPDGQPMQIPPDPNQPGMPGQGGYAIAPGVAGTTVPPGTPGAPGVPGVPTFPGGQTSPTGLPVPAPVDVGGQVSGVPGGAQPNAPPGYTMVNGQLVPVNQVPGSNPQTGLPQGNVPPGYTMVNGQLVPLNQVPGGNPQPGFPQGNAPPGYTMVNGQLVPIGQMPGAVPQPGNPQYPGAQPAYPGMPGPPVNSQTGGVSPAYPTTPGSQGVSPGFPQPGLQTGQTPNAAAEMIGRILTTPRPGGLQGITGSAAPMGPTIGGGIAGVASTSEREGIMMYADHSKYDEWEFTFDMTKYKPIANPLTGSIGTPAGQLGSMQGTSPPGQPIAPAAGFGAGNSGFSSSGFGQAPGAATPAPGSAGQTGFGSQNPTPDVRLGRP
jgi:hypothetical protein